MLVAYVIVVFAVTVAINELLIQSLTKFLYLSLSAIN